MTDRRHPLFSLLLSLILALPGAAGAKDIFVGTNGKDTNPGDSQSTPLRTIAAASAKAQPGDTVQILPGRYQEPIRPVRSGQPGKPIVYRSFGPTPAVITHGQVLGLASAIDIQNRNDIVVDGIHVDGVKRAPEAHVRQFVTVNGSTRISILNGKFRYAHGWYGIGVQQGSSFVRIENNDIDFVGRYDNGQGTDSDTGDAILIGKSGGASKVLVQGNRVRHAGHNLLAVWGRESVIQFNHFDNSFRDILGGQAGGRAAALMGDGNVFQYNTVTGSGASSDAPTNALMKVEGANNIARFNAFYDGVDVGVSSVARKDQPRAARLRIYGNTFYRLGGAAWRMEMFDGAQEIGDNAFMNNLVVDARLNPLSAVSNNDLVFKVGRANAGPTARSVVLNNLFGPGEPQHTALLDGFDGVLSLQQAQKKYPQFFLSNTSVSGQFLKVDPELLPDFDLFAGCPAVDGGGFLAKTLSAGRSKTIKVSDTRFFSAGNGLVPGDLVQLQGSRERAHVMRIDHVAKTLTLDQELDFAAGQGVALAYEGTAPDIGAREWGGGRKPSPPAQLSAQ